jgi:hypothetical protein
MTAMEGHVTPVDLFREQPRRVDADARVKTIELAPRRPANSLERCTEARLKFGSAAATAAVTSANAWSMTASSSASRVGKCL